MEASRRRNEDKKTNIPEEIPQRSPAKNPFRRKTPVKNKKQEQEERDTLKRARAEYDDCESSTSVTSYSQYPALDKSVISCVDVLLTVNAVTVVEDDVEKIKREGQLPIDWALRTRVRFLSQTPFPWSQEKKPFEAASAITAFARVIDLENSKTSLDKSLNTRFHQCCNSWQYPFFSGVDLIHRGPRNAIKDSASDVPFLHYNTNDTTIRDKLFAEWNDSFRNLFWLVQAKRCPYFYVLANAFTCTFRASSFGGYEELNAMIYPTTQELRDVLKLEDIKFTMPLLEENEHSSELFTKKTLEDAKTGEDEEPERWLETMGAEKSEIKRLQSSQSELVSSGQRKIDSTKESLVVVTGVEAQALFNWLIKYYRSTVSNTGPHVVMPPTLLAPVVFIGATLKPHEVRQSIVKVDGRSYNSIEVKGPILPDAVYSFCDLLSTSLTTFTATFENLERTKPFTLAAESKKEYCDSQKSEDEAKHLFVQQNLSNYGLRDSVLKKFCSATTKAFDSVIYTKAEGYSIS